MIRKTVFLAAGVALLLAEGAQAGEGLAFAAEVDSCVAAVNTHVVHDDATRVRHVISNPQRTGIGYSLTIRTVVVAGASERQYEARCVANGSNPPLKFRIEEIDS